MTVSAQQKGVELREVVITATKIECLYCGDSIIYTSTYITKHQQECPYIPIPCSHCGVKVPRCELNEENHYFCSCDGYKMECEYCGAQFPVYKMNEHYCESTGSNTGSGSGCDSGLGGIPGYGTPGSNEHWNYSDVKQLFDVYLDNSRPASGGTYTPRWGDVLISGINIPEYFPLKFGTKDCATTTLAYLFLLATPNMTYKTFGDIQEYFYDYVWDHYDHSVWNDRGLNQIEKNEMFPEFGLDKVSPNEIMNSLESGNPVYGALRTGYYDANHNWHYYDITHDDSYPKVKGHAVAIVGYNPLHRDFICMDPDRGRITYYPMADFQCGYAIPTNQSTHWQFNLNNQYNPYVNRFMIGKK